MSNKELLEKIIEVIDSLRVYINQDGGDVEFIKFENNNVYIKVLGACVGCNALEFTYKDGLETILKEEIPEINEVIIVE